MSLEDQLFENMPTKSIKFIDQVINTSLKNEDEEKNRTFLWKNVLKTGNIDRETINKINEKNEHILGFIFKSIRNNNHNKLEINKNNVRSLVVSDDWKSVHSRKNNNIDIEFSGYIEIEMEKRKKSKLCLVGLSRVTSQMSFDHSK